MVILPITTIAFKCFECGDINYKKVNIFDFSKTKHINMYCNNCHKNNLRIKYLGNKLLIVINCFACNNAHVFEVNLKNFINNNLNKFLCPNTNIELCYIGEEDFIRKAIDIYESDLDAILDEYDDYDNYFTNSSVMLNMINQIHDIAEKGNLSCKCGQKNILLHMYQDKVMLQCYSCNTYELIRAGNNSDLRDVIERGKIILNKELKGVN